MRIAVIGAGGHVGLPLTLLCSKAGNLVDGYDINKDVVKKLNKGIMPFYEEGAEELLKKEVAWQSQETFGRRNLKFTSRGIRDDNYDIFVYILGTPIDEEGNPKLQDLNDCFEKLDRVLKAGRKRNPSYRPTIILRSTVAPGTTKVLDDILEGNQYDLFFIPERVLQGKSLEETVKHDWVIGTKELITKKNRTVDYSKLNKFTKTLGINNFHYVFWKEAEIGKLMTNMYRYMNFAFANEMYMIADHHGCDAHKIIHAFNSNYDRLDVPMPGPNVGGPCLFKDGKFLTTHIPYADLIDVSFQINEGMPEYLVKKAFDYNTGYGKGPALILGATFKADCDDTRNSLSFKLKKVLSRHGIESYIHDPYYDEEQTIDPEKAFFGCVFLMTPHKEFDSSFMDNLVKLDANPFQMHPEGFVLVDVWKHFEVSDHTTDGCQIIEYTKYFGFDVRKK